MLTISTCVLNICIIAISDVGLVPTAHTNVLHVFDGMGHESFGSILFNDLPPATSLMLLSD